MVSQDEESVVTKSLPERSVEEIAREIMTDLSAWLTQYVGPREPLRLLEAEIATALRKERERGALAETGVSALTGYLDSANETITKLEERCSAYKGQVESGASEIERLRARVEELAGLLETVAQIAAPQPNGRAIDDIQRDFDAIRLIIARALTAEKETAS
jgi:chromosome segregation ATPase